MASENFKRQTKNTQENGILKVETLVIGAEVQLYNSTENYEG